MNYLAEYALDSLHYSSVMALQLKIVSEHRNLVGDNARCVFREDGGTIGRSLQNDWILPDPDRFISGRHAVIDFKGGIYYLVDTSANGVFINGDCEPIGKGVPRRLFNGDMIRMGDFEIAVTVEHGESLTIPLEGSAPVVTDHRNSLVEEDVLKTGALLLDEREMTDDEEFQSVLFGAPVETDVVDEPTAATDNKPEKPAATPLSEADLVATDLVDSFLDGLGISRADLHPSTDLGEVMQNAGEVLREFVEGTNELLASRANLKTAFRLDQTTALPRRNNPLKLAANTKASIKQLLIGKEGEYLGPRDAVREVCRDLLFHQDAFLDAMSSAFLDFSDRFDPDELIQGFDRTMGSTPFFSFVKKARYWALYCDQYPSMTEKGGGRFPQLFAEEFVKSYEQLIADFRHVGGPANHLAKTVVLDKSKLKSQSDMTAGAKEKLPEKDLANEKSKNKAEA